jgi:hypothetical protein
MRPSGLHRPGSLFDLLRAFEGARACNHDKIATDFNAPESYFPSRLTTFAQHVPRTTHIASQFIEFKSF